MTTQRERRERRVPGAGEAVLAIARVTVARLARGRLVWFVPVVAGLPSLVALVFVLAGHQLAQPGDPPRAVAVARATFRVVQLLCAVLPPMLVGAAVGDELGSRSASYLWSRPLPRWTVLAGKLVVLAPLCAVALAACWAVALAIGGAAITAQGLAGVAAGGLAVAVVVAAIAALGPRHGVAFSAVYVLLIDMPLGAVPAAVRQLSLVHQMGVLAGLPAGVGEPPPDAPGVAALWLAGIAALWLCAALWRLADREV